MFFVFEMPGIWLEFRPVIIIDFDEKELRTLQG